MNSHTIIFLIDMNTKYLYLSSCLNSEIQASCLNSFYHLYREADICMEKHLILREMLNMGLKIVLQKWLTLVDICVIMGHGSICSSDPQDCLMSPVQNDWVLGPGDCKPESGFRA